MAALPVLVPSAKMAAVEKRRQAVAPAAAPAANFTDNGRVSMSRGATAAESEEDFLRQVGVTEMLRAALLKVLEARPEEPIAFLAHYFENMGLRSPANGGAGEPPGQFLLQQQRLGRALWHLRLAHHSQRCGLAAGGAAGPQLQVYPTRARPLPARGFLGVVVLAQGVLGVVVCVPLGARAGSSKCALSVAFIRVPSFLFRLWFWKSRSPK
jgi:hypothetical protein